jgi:hypothetical protein
MNGMRIVDDLTMLGTGVNAPSRQCHQWCSADKQIKAIVEKANAQRMPDQSGRNGVEDFAQRKAPVRATRRTISSKSRVRLCGRCVRSTSVRSPMSKAARIEQQAVGRIKIHLQLVAGRNVAVAGEQSRERFLVTVIRIECVVNDRVQA